jgi:hypothetical protein
MTTLLRPREIYSTRVGLGVPVLRILKRHRALVFRQRKIAASNGQP